MKITRSDILNELKELSPLLAGLEKINVFTVPNGYFETISAAILTPVKEEEKNSLSGLSRQSAFDVPLGYFDSLAENILTKIKGATEQTYTDELKESFSILYTIQNENVYKVPEGYFEGLAASVLQKLQPQLVKVVPVRKYFSFFKYAVAASIAGIMIFGIYKTDKSGSNNISTNSSLSASLLNPSIQRGENMDQQQFDETLNNLSTQEIANYLEKHNDEADIAVLTSNLDANSVPNQDDYLVNEKTLDNYLQQLNSTTSIN